MTFVTTNFKPPKTKRSKRRARPGMSDEPPLTEADLERDPSLAFKYEPPSSGEAVKTTVGFDAGVKCLECGAYPGNNHQDWCSRAGFNRTSPTPDTEALVGRLHKRIEYLFDHSQCGKPDHILLTEAAAELKRLQAAEIDAGLAIAQLNRNELALRAKLAEAEKALKALDDYWTEDFPEGPDVHETKPGLYGPAIHRTTADIWRQLRAALAAIGGET